MMTFLQHIYSAINIPNDAKVFVLGFYDRNNAGDEMYKYVMPRIFPMARFTFGCMDDVQTVPDGTDFVICGGGDIINRYFMSKAESIFSSYTGKIYAFSVGIPYVSDARYLHLFDHVFARSTYDYAIACAEIGSKNVTCMPDASMSLCKPGTSTAYNRKSRVAICLAQPAFYKNPKKKEMLSTMAGALYELLLKQPNTEFYLLSFNYGDVKSESDLEVNTELREALIRLDPDFPVFFPQNLNDPVLLLIKIKKMDVVLCMRYHSLLFSVINKKLVVALYCTPKMEHIVKDLEDNLYASCRLDSDEKGLPLSIDGAWLCATLLSCMRSQMKLTLPKPDWSAAKRLMFDDKKAANMIIKNRTESFDDTLLICKKTLMKYLDIGNIEYEDMLNKQSVLNVKSREYAEISRLLCYCVTKSMQSPYVWGLMENMQRADFCLYGAIKYIWEDFNKRETDRNPGESYFPDVDIERRVFLNMDFVFQSDFGGYHRSGWAYAIGGLMALDARRMLRGADTMIDTYVDRSFHWGQDTLQTIGVLPYKRPWLGFVHHTFDTAHSTYNCASLFQNPLFLESLQACKGLIALSEYLAKDLRAALARAGMKAVPVHAVCHPMETVERAFTMARFQANGDRKLVQIGAWLRNPYAIYELPLWKNRLRLQKAALRGKEMEHYFRPQKLIEDLSGVLSQDFGHPADAAPVCRQNNVNKYCEGLCGAIQKNDRSVRIIEKLSNEDYDALLSENIVFLNLVDCSAVNTVIECLVRNTPLVVNRHPAIEEVFGKDYPGFYENLVDATVIVNSACKIEEIHACLKRIDKRRFSLNTFVNDVQNIVARGAGKLPTTTACRTAR